jgi:hypothetical protein
MALCQVSFPVLRLSPVIVIPPLLDPHSLLVYGRNFMKLATDSLLMWNTYFPLNTSHIHMSTFREQTEGKDDIRVVSRSVT